MNYKKIQLENINAGLFTLALSGGCDDTRGKCSYGEFVVRNIIAIAIVITIFIINIIIVVVNIIIPLLKKHRTPQVRSRLREIVGSQAEGWTYQPVRST